MLDDPPADFESHFLVLTNQGPTGLAYLLDLATRDIPHLSLKILDHLSRTESVILAILIPALLNAATDPSLTRQRDLALAALNRLAPLLTPQHLRILSTLINDPTIDKTLLLATLRTSGLPGEQLLLDIINSKQHSESTTTLALSLLSYPIPTTPALRIKAIEYTLEHSFLPGRLYQYEGSLIPWNYQQ